MLSNLPNELLIVADRSGPAQGWGSFQRKRMIIMAKKRTPQEQSIDPAAQEMLARAEKLGIGTAFSRADEMLPCNIGAAGMCCKQCGMGPCRLTKDGQTGVCGATIDTIQARNLVRSIASGAAAHSDHGRDMAFILKAVANGETEGYVDPRCRQASHRWQPATESPLRNAPRTKSPMTWQINLLPSLASRMAKSSRWCAHRKSARSCGKRSMSSRAGSTARWSKRCTARILAMTRTLSTLCSTPCARR